MFVNAACLIIGFILGAELMKRPRNKSGKFTKRKGLKKWLYSTFF